MSRQALICVPLAVIGLGRIVAFAQTDDPVNAVAAAGPLDPWFDKTWRPGEIEQQS